MQRPRHAVLLAFIVAVSFVALAVGGGAAAAIGDRPALVNGENEFGFSLYRGLRATNPGVNIVFAPYALAVGIESLALGAKGATRTQLVTAIGASSLPAARLQAASRGLREELREADQHEVRVANILVADRAVTITSSYRQTLSADYEQQVLPGDFGNAPERARQQANSWVAGATSLLIPEVFKAGSITRDTRLVMANSLFLRAEWLRRLVTVPNGPFARAGGRSLDVRRVGTGATPGFFPTIRKSNYRAIVLPYRGARLAMAIVLPDAGRFSQVEAAFTPGLLNDVLLNSRKRLVNFEAPSFFLAQRIEDIRSSLADLGVVDVFDRTRADLTSMASVPNLSVDAAIHEVTFGFDNQGTEEGVGGSGRGSGGESASETFTVDRPFLFWVVDRPTGAVLFMGRVVDPSVL